MKTTTLFAALLAIGCAPAEVTLEIEAGNTSSVDFEDYLLCVNDECTPPSYLAGGVASGVTLTTTRTLYAHHGDLVTIEAFAVDVDGYEYWGTEAAVLDESELFLSAVLSDSDCCQVSR